MNRWIAFYVKHLSKNNRFKIEIHGWECESESPEEALKALEENSSVPFRIFLAKVVPHDQKNIWLEESQQEAKQLGLTSPKFVMH